MQHSKGTYTNKETESLVYEYVKSDQVPILLLNFKCKRTCTGIFHVF